MRVLGEYILSVTAAAILCGILQSLTKKKDSICALLRLICGIFLVFTVVAPISRIEPDILFDIPMNYTKQGMAITTQGYQASWQQLHDIIKQQCEAYILDEARCCQAALVVDVVLNEDSYPVPVAVTLQGDVSPYAKKALQDWIEVNMGISKENQRWIE